MNVLVFDIETIPDIEGGQNIHNLHGLDDESTSKALFHLQKQQTGSDELPVYLQRIASISVVYRGMGDDMGHEISVRSLGDEDSTEAELLVLFFEKIEKRTPTLVSWNGSGFDLPVIHYRSLKNQVSAPGYWGKGDNNSAFKHENYLSRYHDRHTDLMDLLTSYNKSATAPEKDIALMLGFPGKIGMEASQVWDEYQKGNITGIRQYGETGVLNTYLIFLRFQLIRGVISPEELQQEFNLLREKLEQSEELHLQEFSRAWAQK